MIAPTTLLDTLAFLLLCLAGALAAVLFDHVGDQLDILLGREHAEAL